MEIERPIAEGTARIAILPGSFHPPTVAHLGLGSLALTYADAVLFTLPRAFPHKSYEAVPLEERLRLLHLCLRGEPRFYAAVTAGGLFIDMAREARQEIPAAREILLVCGRDAAERIVGWNYDREHSIEQQLEEYSLLVAGRQGSFIPPERLSHRVVPLDANGVWDDISSTRVREAITTGGPWRSLVPAAIHDEVERLYSPLRLDSRNARNR
jgi:nicotinate-nucleotide adenylyltransferase